MNSLTIQKATTKDVNSVMGFIGQEWKKTIYYHRIRKLFRYEFCEGTDLNFVLAKKPDNKIVWSY